MPIDRNAIKLAQMLDLNAEKAAKLISVMPLSDLAALTTAINSDDFLSVREIYNRYKDEINDLPTPQEIKSYYDDQLMANSDTDEALASTADFFGIKGEDVQRLLGNVNEDTRKDRPIFIPDVQVKRAYENINVMLKGGKSNGSITEVKNVWQRRMMYGLIPKVVSDIIQDVIDMTPLAVIQQYNMQHGYGESAIVENQLSLSAMMEAIIEDKLHNVDDDGEPEIQVNLDMGTLEPEDVDKITELEAPNLKFNSEKYNGWDLSWSKEPINGKHQGVARKKNNITIPAAGETAEEVESKLKHAVDNNKGSKDLGGSKTVVDFNVRLVQDILGHAEAIKCDVTEENGVPVLIIGDGKYTAVDRHVNKAKADAIGQQAFSIPTNVAMKAGLKNARYSLDLEKAFKIGKGTAYPLKHESDLDGNRVMMKKPGITVASVNPKPKIGESIANLIKSITKKRF